MLASPKFNQKYGTYSAAEVEYDASAVWLSGLSTSERAGEIFGLFIAG